MPIITVTGGQRIKVAEGTRLAIAVEDSGTNIGHRCGGYARCTTCRVEFIEGEPSVCTRAEYEKLKERSLFGSVRLSCQIVAEHDMTVKPLMTVEEMGWADPGPPLEETVMPEPDWMEMPSAEDSE